MFKSPFGPLAQTAMLRALSIGRVATSIGQIMTTCPRGISGTPSRVSISAAHMTLLLLGRQAGLTLEMIHRGYR